MDFGAALAKAAKKMPAPIAEGLGTGSRQLAPNALTAGALFYAALTAPECEASEGDADKGE